MSSRSHRVLCGLALGIVAGVLHLQAAPLPDSQLKALKAQEPQRAAQTLAFARQSFSKQAPGASLTIKNTFTSPEGRTVVRLDQTLNGVRVYGASGIAHMDANGRQKLVSRGLVPDAAPTGTPKLSAAQALSAARQHLGLKGQALAPKAELVAFPTRLTGGLQVRWDAASKRFVTDRAASLLSKPASEPVVWAYEVNLATWNREDGMSDMHLVVDAATGAILRKQNNLHGQAASGTPVKGMGKGQYVGEVTLDTMKATDGTYALRDLTRGTLPVPYFSLYEGLDLTGLFTLGESHEGGNPADWNAWGLNFWYEGRAANGWGDGLPFAGFPHEADVNGETAAVDAQYGLAQTWDLLKNIFGRDGIDNLGTTVFAQVHVREPFYFGGGTMTNAFWNDALGGMFFGDGNFAEDRALKDAEGNTIVIPGNPKGYMSLTELDVTAHELAHGLTWKTAGFSYGGESGGLNEGASDILGSLVEAYASRPAGADGTIPNTGTDWLMGSKISLSGPLRFIKKPSLDGLSADGWYKGLDWLDPHYSSGPLNRWFYFLAQGAPSSQSDEAFSPYLQGGMTGIGNDAAARIWYKALTEELLPMDTYETAAVGVIAATTELYGAGSTEVRAVKNAFRAINVQVEGDPLLTRVEFPIVNVGGFSGRNPNSLMARTVILPMGVTVFPVAEVRNNPDTRVTFTVGGHLGSSGSTPGDPFGAGQVGADGSYTTPYKLGWFVFTAHSAAEPAQFAEGLLNIMNLDTDDDSEQDAVDMGSTALSYWMGYSLKPSHSPYGGPWVEDMDADFFQVAIRNAWGVPRVTN